MRFIVAVALISAVFCQEMLVTQEMTDYLKRTVDWEVVDYEDNVFRGWTAEEFDSILGYTPGEEFYPEYEIEGSVPSSIDWTGANCDHGPKNQGACGSCWAFAATGMVSDRCCLMKADKGWLSPQELVSCDKMDSGCQGGGLDTPLDYIKQNHGLVPDECFPYIARNSACPNKCKDGSDWKKAHVCDCTSYSICNNPNGMKKCLANGPATFGFYVCSSFMYYKSGIYKCDCTKYRGGHAVEAMGFSETPECHYIVKNSWGATWGDKGYFKISCTTCNMVGGVACTNFA